MASLISSFLSRGAGAIQSASVPDQATVDKIAAEAAKLVCGKLRADAEQLSGKVANFIKPELEKDSTIRHITAEVGKEIANRIVDAPEIIIEPMVAAMTKKFPDTDPNVNLQGLIDAVTARITANKEPPRTEDVIEERKEIEKQEDKLIEAEEEKKPEIVDTLSTSSSDVPLPPPPPAPEIINGVAHFPESPAAAVASVTDLVNGQGLGALPGLADSAKNMAETTTQNAAQAAESAAKTGASTAITSALGPAAAFLPKGAAAGFANSLVDSAKGDVMGSVTTALAESKGGQSGGAEYSFRPELDFSQFTRRKRHSKRRKNKKRSSTHTTKRRNKHRKKSKTKRSRK